MPTIKTIVTPWPNSLKKEDTHNFAPAKAEVPASLAGRNRWINEFLRGRCVSYREDPGGETEPSATPDNPQGLTGLDHSGPPYGVSLRHPLASYASIKYQHGTSPLNDERAIEIKPANDATAFKFSVFNKPFPPIADTPASRVAFAARFYNQSGVTGTVTIKITTGGRSKTLTTGSIADNALPTYFFHDFDDQIEVISGRNDIHMSVITFPGTHVNPDKFYMLSWELSILGKTGAYIP